MVLRYEGAERDCTTVLSLSKSNVKALFRRGQARISMGKLLEAQEGFSVILRFVETPFADNVFFLILRPQQCLTD